MWYHHHNSLHEHMLCYPKDSGSRQSPFLEKKDDCAHLLDLNTYHETVKQWKGSGIITSSLFLSKLQTKLEVTLN